MVLTLPQNTRLACIAAILLLGSGYTSWAQDEKKEAPEINEAIDRAEEDYRYLKEEETAEEYETIFAQDLKYLSFDTDKRIYLSVGGQYRSRFESTSNIGYTEENESYYSQRFSLNVNFHLGENFRYYAEIDRGTTSDAINHFLEDDNLAFHQNYLEIKIPTKEKELLFTIGRKQMEIGYARIVSRRDGPNMRRSFDLVKTDFNSKNYALEFFYGREVRPDFDAFDNEFTLLDGDAEINPYLWGVNTDFRTKGIIGNTELYYLGYRNTLASFSDVSGEEIRHSVGIRRYGEIGKRGRFNTEVVYQFGDLDNNTISAFDIELDYKYIIKSSTIKPTFGLRFDYSSGDRSTGDGSLNSYNPIFVNPAIYSLAAVNTPVNLNGLHPNFKIYPLEGLSIYTDYAFFFRSQREDALYQPTSTISRESDAGRSAFIGNAIGIKVLYEINRNILFEWITTYFIPGDFIEESGDSNNIFYTAPTLEFNF